MTTCQQAHTYIERSAAGELTAADARALEQHTASCQPCAIRLRWENRISEELQRNEIPAPGPDFEARVLAAATGRSSAASGSRGRRKWASPVVGGAVAAALALGLFLGSGIENQDSPETFAASGSGQQAQDENPTSVPGYREQTVRLAFSAKSELDDVSLTLELPANVELASFPGHRELTWQVDLKAGDNVIALPLRVAWPEAGELVAHLDDGEKRKTFRAPIPGMESLDQEPSS
ncbi:anti-sigma factor family protein [Marinobacter sp.]|uniref:anti-sigma factor family protein n=1 Tax=Marinobacter sp. TaxID=50741 RepID=UPI00384AC949